jgi:DMSO/TMAO reductase YedYZ heme-binding membrane subunit
VFYLSYGAWGVELSLWPDWGEDHPMWRAFAHSAFVLLFLSLILGPVSRLWRPMARFLPWRREFGVWFTILSIGHGYIIWDRWAQWNLATLFGFEYVAELGNYILVRPEVGIMNMMGLVVFPMMILLAVTSFDGAISVLGSAWKWLHSALVYAIFYILMLRGILYFFFFFQFSPPNWRFYPPIWFLYVFLGMGIVVVLLQAAAFIKTVLQRRRKQQKNSAVQVVAVFGVAVLFVLPMALMTGTVAYFDSRVVKPPPTLSGQPVQFAQNSARNFHRINQKKNQDVHLWAQDFGDMPYSRQINRVVELAILYER